MNLDFLVIASSDPLASTGASHSSDLALGLARVGQRVGLFLVQNGVVSARRGALFAEREALADAGVTIQADAFSLRERGVGRDAIADGVEVSDLAPILDALGAGTRVLWT